MALVGQPSKESVVWDTLTALGAGTLGGFAVVHSGPGRRHPLRSRQEATWALTPPHPTSFSVSCVLISPKWDMKLFCQEKITRLAFYEPVHHLGGHLNCRRGKMTFDDDAFVRGVSCLGNGRAGLPFKCDGRSPRIDCPCLSNTFMFVCPPPPKLNF